MSVIDQPVSATYELSDKYIWVLKMVQAAVAGNGSGLDFAYKRFGTRVLFALPKMPDPAGLQRHLLSDELPDDPFWHELMIGLKHLMPLGKILFSFGKTCQLRWDGQQLIDVSGSQVPVDPERFGIVLLGRKRVYHSTGYGKGYPHWDPQEFWLEERARTAPLDITIQGRHITRSMDFDRQVHNRGLAYGLLTRAEFDGVAEIREPLVMGDVKTDDRGWQAGYARWDRPPEQPVSKFELECVMSQRRGVHEHQAPEVSPEGNVFALHFTRNGVVCASVSQRTEIGGWMTFPVDQGATDASGLVMQHLYLDDVQQALERAKVLIPISRSLRQNIERAHFDPTPAALNGRRIGAFIVAAALGTLAFFLSAFVSVFLFRDTTVFKFVVGSVSLATFAYTAYTHLRKAGDPEHEIKALAADQLEQFEARMAEQRADDWPRSHGIAPRAYKREVKALF